jgi:hypothetical protein
MQTASIEVPGARFTVQFIADSESYSHSDMSSYTLNKGTVITTQEVILANMLLPFFQQEALLPA